jgi:hypothetical protein
MLRSADWWLITDVSGQPIETSLSNGKLRCVTSQKSKDLILLYLRTRQQKKSLSS